MVLAFTSLRVISLAKKNESIRHCIYQTPEINRLNITSNHLHISKHANLKYSKYEWKKGKYQCYCIWVKDLTFFLFFNFFFVFVSLNVRFLRHLLDFLFTFSYKSEKYKYTYVKYEQCSINLIFLKCNTVPLKSEPRKNPEINRDSKIKIYRIVSFLIYIWILMCLYVF